MTNRQQSAFFLAIVFLFTSGIGLVIYRQYDLYYQQKTATDLETASTAVVPIKKPSASSTPDQISGWKTYKNTEDGFEFEVPKMFNIVDNTFVYDPNKVSWPSVSIQVEKFNTVVTQDPQDQDKFLKLKQAISSQNKSQVMELVPNRGIDISFQNGGILLIYSETQAADYAIEYQIFDDANNLIIINAGSGYNATNLDQSFSTIKQSEAYKNLEQIAQSFKFTK